MAASAPMMTNLTLPIDVADGYLSSSQRIRVMTEHWVDRQIFCPHCGSSLVKLGNNLPVADFCCATCLEQYELKSKQGEMRHRVVDGAYSTMIARLRSESNPNLFFLSYDKSTFAIRNFLAIPKYFFVPGIIEKRPALADTARRAGWVGCNILLSGIPEFGKVYYIRDGVPSSKKQVLEKWNETEFMRSAHNVEARGWLLDVLLCVERIAQSEFSLTDVYMYEPHLKAKHPDNNNVRAKIRQQLQFLRDKGVIAFEGAGTYRMKN